MTCMFSFLFFPTVHSSLCPGVGLSVTCAGTTCQCPAANSCLLPLTVAGQLAVGFCAAGSSR